MGSILVRSMVGGLVGPAPHRNLLPGEVLDANVLVTRLNDVDGSLEALVADATTVWGLTTTPGANAVSGMQAGELLDFFELEMDYVNTPDPIIIGAAVGIDDNQCVDMAELTSTLFVLQGYQGDGVSIVAL